MSHVRPSIEPGGRALGIPGRGFSMIELLVVMGVIGLLVSLLLPAVVRVREASRRAQCAACLQQLGLAAQLHLGDHNHFPSGRFHNPSDRSREFSNYSPQSRLLPYLEQDAVFNSVNFEVGTWSAAAPGISMSEATECNRTASATRIEAFVCPSQLTSAGLVNFRANTGPHPFTSSAQTYADLAGLAFGPFTPLDHAVGAADVSDGLSHTVLFSERVAGDFDDRVFTPFPDLADLSSNPQTPDDYAAACRDLGDPGPAHRSSLGSQWLFSGFDTLYNHTLPPNSSTPDCGHAPGGPVLFGTVSARSYHLGGVNTLFADGHVRFISSDVDSGIWRAIGGRNDNISVGAY